MHTPCAEEPSAQNRQPRSLWVRRPARGWTGREGRKTEERGCKYGISVVYVCVCTQICGVPATCGLAAAGCAPPPLPPAGVFFCPCVTLGRDKHPGSPEVPMAVPSTLPPPALSFSSATGSATKLEKPLHVSEPQFSPFRKSGHG